MNAYSTPNKPPRARQAGTIVPWLNQIHFNMPVVKRVIPTKSGTFFTLLDDVKVSGDVKFVRGGWANLQEDLTKSIGKTVNVGSAKLSSIRYTKDGVEHTSTRWDV